MELVCPTYSLTLLHVLALLAAATLYNSPSSFEALTTHVTNKRYMAMNVVWEGKARETLERWCKHKLLGAAKPSAKSRYLLRTWHNDTLVQAGAAGDWRTDVTELARQAAKHL